MIFKTQAIVLKTLKYSDTSLIINCFSKNHGYISLIKLGAFSKSNRHIISILQPLSIINLIYYKKENQNLGKMKDCTPIILFINIQTHPHKTMICLFLSEILQKSLYSESENQNLFVFIETCLIWLEDAVTNYANFHLYFLANITKYIGFFPSELKKKYFDFSLGTTSSTVPVYGISNAKISKLFCEFFTIKLSEISSIKLNQKMRRVILHHFIEYYIFHTSIQKINSLDIIEVLNE